VLIFADVARALTLLLASGGLCALALVLARFFRLNRLWVRVPLAPSTPEQVVEELVALAQVAKAQGLLSLESAAEGSRLPLLRRGVSLVMSGVTPTQLRSTLESELESSMGKFHFAQVLLPATFWLLLTASIVGAITAQFLAAVAAASGHTPSDYALLAPPAIAALLCLPTIYRLTHRSQATRMMTGMLVVEGLFLIASGADSAAARTRLMSYLPALPPAKAEAIAA
jgi:chemotaxis protein MotA